MENNGIYPEPTCAHDKLEYEWNDRAHHIEQLNQAATEFRGTSQAVHSRLSQVTAVSFGFGLVRLPPIARIEANRMDRGLQHVLSPLRNNLHASLTSLVNACHRARRSFDMDASSQAVKDDESTVVSSSGTLLFQLQVLAESLDNMVYSLIKVAKNCACQATAFELCTRMARKFDDQRAVLSASALASFSIPACTPEIEAMPETPVSRAIGYQHVQEHPAVPTLPRGSARPRHYPRQTQAFREALQELAALRAHHDALSVHLFMSHEALAELSVDSYLMAGCGDERGRLEAFGKDTTCEANARTAEETAETMREAAEAAEAAQAVQIAKEEVWWGRFATSFAESRRLADVSAAAAGLPHTNAWARLSALACEAQFGDVTHAGPAPRGDASGRDAPGASALLRPAATSRPAEGAAVRGSDEVAVWHCGEGGGQKDQGGDSPGGDGILEVLVAVGGGAAEAPWPEAGAYSAAGAAKAAARMAVMAELGGVLGSRAVPPTRERSPFDGVAALVADDLGDNLGGIAKRVLPIRGKVPIDVSKPRSTQAVLPLPLPPESAIDVTGEPDGRAERGGAKAASNTSFGNIAAGVPRSGLPSTQESTTAPGLGARGGSSRMSLAHFLTLEMNFPTEDEEDTFT